MSKRISRDDMNRFIAGSKNTVFRSAVMAYVAMHFRSVHYVASEMVCDCIMLNLLLNRKITPTSADEIITNVHRNNKAMYSLVEKSFAPVEDRFFEYARKVLGDKYDEVQALNLNVVKFIVYVISLDMSRRDDLKPEEVFTYSYTYDELFALKGVIPHYD